MNKAKVEIFDGAVDVNPRSRGWKKRFNVPFSISTTGGGILCIHSPCLVVGKLENPVLMGKFPVSHGESPKVSFSIVSLTKRPVLYSLPFI